MYDEDGIKDIWDIDHGKDGMISERQVGKEDSQVENPGEYTQWEADTEEDSPNEDQHS